MRRTNNIDIVEDQSLRRSQIDQKGKKEKKYRSMQQSATTKCQLMGGPGEISQKVYIKLTRPAIYIISGTCTVGEHAARHRHHQHYRTAARAIDHAGRHRSST